MINIEHIFTYHPPRNQKEIENYQQLRTAAKEFAYTIQRLTPESADQSAAIRHVRDALMTANAAIGLEGKL